MFVAVVFIGLSVVMAPMSYYGGFVLPHQFGLSVESNARWFRDWIVGVALSACVTAVAGALLLRAVARFRSWPVIAIAGAAALLVLGQCGVPGLHRAAFQQIHAIAALTADARDLEARARSKASMHPWSTSTT